MAADWQIIANDLNDTILRQKSIGQQHLLALISVSDTEFCCYRASPTAIYGKAHLINLLINRRSGWVFGVLYGTKPLCLNTIILGHIIWILRF